MEIRYLDNHLLAVDKPAGVPSQPDSSGDASLDELAKEYLKREFAKPGEVYLGLLHRLDRPTSGLVLMARTSKAASRMADQFRRRLVEKTYLALVECHAGPLAEARLENLLAPLDNGGMAVCRAGEKKNGAKEARLSYRTLRRLAEGKRALLSVRLETGVKHQIRCQLAHVGLPVVGDFRYGPFGRPARPEPVEGGKAILLHAAELAFEHPVRKEPVRIEAQLPAYWRIHNSQFTIHN